MKKIQYEEILKRAFMLTWKNKFLWFFGFLIILGSFVSNVDVFNGKMTEEGRKAIDMNSFIQQYPTTIMSLGILLVVLMTIFFLLRIVGVTALIKSANDINLYKQLSIKKILLESKRYLWRLLLLEILISFFIGIVVAVLSAPIIYLFTLKAKVFAILSLIGGVIIVIPLVVLAYYLEKYSYYFVTLGNIGIKMSLEFAYAIFQKNLKESLLMGVINIGLNVLILVVSFIIFLALVVIFLPIGFVAYLFSSNAGLVVVLLCGVLILVLILLVLFSWYQSFLQTAWLLFFQQISFEQHDEKIAENVSAEGEVPTPEVV